MTCWETTAAAMTVTMTVMAMAMTVMVMAIPLPVQIMAIGTDRLLNPTQSKRVVIMTVKDTVWTTLMVLVTGWDGQTWKTMAVMTV